MSFPVKNPIYLDLTYLKKKNDLDVMQQKLKHHGEMLISTLNSAQPESTNVLNSTKFGKKKLVLKTPS